VSCHL